MTLFFGICFFLYLQWEIGLFVQKILNIKQDYQWLLSWHYMHIVYIYNIAFVNSERWLAKSRVDITLCQHGKFPATLLLKFFVLYNKRSIKHFFRIGIQLYQHSWKLEKLEIVWKQFLVFPISTRIVNNTRENWKNSKLCENNFSFFQFPLVLI